MARAGTGSTGPTPPPAGGGSFGGSSAGSGASTAFSPAAAPAPQPEPPADRTGIDKGTQNQRAWEAQRLAKKLKALGDENGNNLKGMFQDWQCGISDRGGFFVISPQQSAKSLSQDPTLTDKQLRRILLKAALQHNCDQIWFYKGNKIDKELTARARQMMSNELNSSLALYGKKLEVQTSVHRDRLPWTSTISLHNLIFRPWDNMMEDRANRKAAKDSLGRLKDFVSGVTPA